MSGMLGAGGGGAGSKRNAPPDDGTGYGGAKDDTKRLLAGRKKAKVDNSKDDKASVKFLKQIQKQLSNQKGTTSIRRSARRGGGEVECGLDTDDETKLSSLLADIFRNQVPTDWDQRRELYDVALDVSRTLASSEKLGTVFGDDEDQEEPLYWLLDWSQQAKQILEHSADLNGGTKKAGQQDVKLAREVMEVADLALKISRRCQAPKHVADLSVISLTERYQSELGPLRFDSVDSMQNHFFLQTIRSAPASLNTRNLFKELAGYRTALPVEYGSSCFCRVINSRLDLLRVMITGPDDTPYANGCFLFDIAIPATYPKTPPKVQFLTTGGGKIRFNPNLYNCGKVCLSLLGTWEGPGWISGQSTLLQVLISIQSLILVPDPYYNEPGWEPDRGTPRGDARSKSYNKKIRQYTVSAAIESDLSSILNGTNPYPEFESAMIKHFLEKRSLIQKELWSWVKEDNGQATRVSNVCNLMERLSQRERGASRKKRPRATMSAIAVRANQSNDPIVLDEFGMEVRSAKPTKAVPKVNEAIEIDLSDDDDEDEKKEEKESAGAKTTGLIDLTG